MIRVGTETGPGLDQDMFRTYPGPTGITEMPYYLPSIQAMNFPLSLIQDAGQHYDLLNLK